MVSEKFQLLGIILKFLHRSNTHRKLEILEFGNLIKDRIRQQDTLTGGMEQTGVPILSS